LLEPDAGTVIVGQEVGLLAREPLLELRRRIGYVFQFAALFDSMSVSANVAMGLRRMGTMSESEIAARVRESLGLVELDGFEDRFPARFGRQRGRLARAIAGRATCCTTSQYRPTWITQ
jgi:phospholipid/cholesterol/gamma-HCH transport system ATP-binding protein